MELSEWIRNLELPSLYIPMHREGITHLTQLGFPNRIGTLHDRLQDPPEAMSEEDTTNENHALRATQLLRQARRFIEMSSRSEDEIKPILLYYGIAQVCGFFVSSMCKYGLSGSHGIKVDENLNVSVLERGSFVRFLDVCSLLGVNSEFTKFQWNSAQNDFSESLSNTKYPFSRSLNTLLEDLDRIIRSNPSLNRVASFDQVSYILLFVASHLARYRPELWKKIVEGQGQDTSMIAYRRVMENAQFFHYKVAGSVIAIARGLSPRHVLTASHWEEVDQLCFHTDPSPLL